MTLIKSSTRPLAPKFALLADELHIAALEAMDSFLNLTLTPLTVGRGSEATGCLICERLKILRDGWEDELVMGAG
jgi:hypothetical protein